MVVLTTVPSPGWLYQTEGISNTRVSMMRRHNALKNTIRAVMDEYFPEILRVLKYPLKGKVSQQILKSCPFPYLIIDLGLDEVLAQIKNSVKKTVGQKKAQMLLEAAKRSIGLTYYGTESVRQGRFDLSFKKLSPLLSLKQNEGMSGQRPSEK